MRSLDVEFKELRTNVIRQEILKVETRLKDAVLWEDAPTSIQAYKELEREHSDLLKKEETMWRQRSRAIWLKDGDKNTKFFHGKAGQRKRTNEIKKLKMKMVDGGMVMIMWNMFLASIILICSPLQTPQVWLNLVKVIDRNCPLNRLIGVVETPVR
jgi:hypothetical protein